MISLLISLAVLLIGYCFYGRLAEKVFAPDARKTPALAEGDGVAFVPMKPWKAFLVQLLNIAGTGPIFGALMGACFGPVVFLRIVFGSILGGDFIIKNLKMNKVTVIAQEIGVQPVFSFGNSTGDASMAEYATSNNAYPSLAFMLCCDDTERENGNTEKAQKMFDLCSEFDWVPISMKNDWTTIYGEGVTKK